MTTTPDTPAASALSEEKRDLIIAKMIDHHNLAAQELSDDMGAFVQEGGGMPPASMREQFRFHQEAADLLSSFAARTEARTPHGEGVEAAVDAKAQELDRIAEFCGESDDPFSAWETIELWKVEAEKVKPLQARLAELEHLLVSETSARRAAEETARRVYDCAQDDENARKALAVVRDVFAGPVHIDDVASISLEQLARIDRALLTGGAK